MSTPARVMFTSFAWLAAALATSSLWAAPPRALPEERTKLADRRLEPLKDLDGYFPMQPLRSQQEWERRAAELRRRVLVANGLWPMPAKTPLNAVVHGRLDEGDYTVEKVYFESYPGFYVTGSLYRPKDKSGRLPGVLSPHGHWANGRFHDAGERNVRWEIVRGAERFEDGGRSPLQARCVQLARLGCVVFHYDMLGYADSQQLDFELVHRFAKQRPEMNTVENWGLYSPQAESNLQSVMGLQTLNSVRALDFLESLPDVDPQRLAITGASGGGTQSFLLAAIDDRLAASFPAVMVSTAMQGGCTCENCCLLRVGCGNIDLAALFAPKPQGLTGADDWTREMETKGFPELQAVYELLGAKQNVMLAPLTHFKHNYNYVSRAAMYHWFNKHLKLGFEEPIVEGDYRRLTAEELSVWTGEHRAPPSGPEFEKELLRRLKHDSEQQLAALTPTDAPSLAGYRAVVGGGWETILAARVPAKTDLDFETTGKRQADDHLEIAGLLRDTPRGAELPVVFLYPKDWNRRAVIWSTATGKAGLYQADGALRPEIARLVAAGTTVVGIDLLHQGEFQPDGQPLTQTRRVRNPREAAPYTFGYNHAVFVERVHDLLTLVGFLETHELTPDRIDLAGVDGAGLLAAAARVTAGERIGKLAVDTGGFRFAGVLDLHSPDFVPGGSKYHDVPGLLALGAPHAVWLAGEGGAGPEVVAAAYRAAGAATAVQVAQPAAGEVSSAAAAWLLAE